MVDLFDSGTKMVFFQASAPTGWTQDTTHNDKVMRVVSGTGAGTGGSVGFTSASAVAGHAQIEAEMPKHYHQMRGPDLQSAPTNSTGTTGNDWYYGGASQVNAEDYGTWSVGGGAASGTESFGTGNGTAHTHALDVHYLDVIVCTKD
jgi:hypothetical protein